LAASLLLAPATIVIVYATSYLLLLLEAIPRSHNSHMHATTLPRELLFK
jgi:hypothetical protein